MNESLELYRCPNYPGKVLTGFKCIRPNLDSEIAAYAKNGWTVESYHLTEYQAGGGNDIREGFTVVMMKDDCRSICKYNQQRRK